jgi:Spy/CpxP family protein refolding chaperone
MNTTGYKKIAILVVPLVAILAVLVLCTQLSAARGTGRFGIGTGGWVYDRPGPERGIRAPLMERGAGPNSSATGIMRLVRRLDLTDEQVEQIKETIKTSREKIQAAQKAVAEARKALNETVAKSADEAAIRDAATAVGKALGDAAVLRANTKTAVEKILTDEQRAKLEELREEMKERRDLRAGEVQRPGARGRFQQRGLREDVWPGPPYGRGPMFYGPGRAGPMRRGWMREPFDQGQGRGQPWGW